MAIAHEIARNLNKVQLSNLMHADSAQFKPSSSRVLASSAPRAGAWHHVPGDPGLGELDHVSRLKSKCSATRHVMDVHIEIQALQARSFGRGLLRIPLFSEASYI